MKVFWLFNHPASYKIDFFNLLGKSVDLNVVFERRIEGKRNRLFYSSTPKSFKTYFPHSLKLGEINNFTRLPIRILRKEKFDLVVINGISTFSEQMAISYCRKKRIPYVMAINGGIRKREEPSFKRFLKKHYIKGATYYLSPDDISDEYLVFYGADKSKIYRYPYSTIYEKQVLLEPIKEAEKNRLKREFDLQGKRVFVSVGQFIKRKNNEMLLEAWKSLPKDYVLYLYGDGPLEESYKNRINELGLKNIFVRPYISHDQVVRLYSASDCLLFPTLEDIYGHVVNEALSQGLPVISSKHSNAAMHLIKEGKNGFLIDDNISSLIDAIKHIDDLSKNEALLVAKENTIEKMTESHLETFRKWLKK